MKPNSLLKALILFIAAALFLLSCVAPDKSTEATAPTAVKKDTSLANRRTAGSHPVSKKNWEKIIDDSNKVISEVEQDDAGTYFVIGYTSKTLIENGDTLKNLGGNDIFLARYDNEGNLVWMNHAGGWLDEVGNDIAVDTRGNIYITGYFYGEATFDTITIDSHGLQDIFIAKYDPFGHCLWAESEGGENDDAGLNISVDLNLTGAGTLHVVGYFSGGKATFGDGQITSPNDEQYFTADFSTETGLYKSMLFIQR